MILHLFIWNFIFQEDDEGATPSLQLGKKTIYTAPLNVLNDLTKEERVRLQLLFFIFYLAIIIEKYRIFGVSYNFDSFV